jgi:predicted nucleic acid-binding protein
MARLSRRINPVIRRTVFFVDTSFWIAIFNAKDQDHVAARNFMRSLWLTGELLTSSFVIIEFLNYFSELGVDTRNNAASFVRSIEADPRVKVVPLSMDLYQRGMAHFERFADKGWSLTDCISFLIMEDRDLRDALTFDRHFIQAGFASPLI